MPSLRHSFALLLLLLLPLLLVLRVYFNQAISRYTRYQRMLAGFTKVSVPASGSTNASLSIPYADLAYWDPQAEDMVLEAGSYTFFVCSNSRDCPAAASHVVQVPRTITGL